MPFSNSQNGGKAIEADIDEVNAMTLATASADGVPSARIVLLKEFDEKDLCSSRIIKVSKAGAARESKSMFGVFLERTGKTG